MSLDLDPAPNDDEFFTMPLVHNWANVPLPAMAISMQIHHLLMSLMMPQLILTITMYCQSQTGHRVKLSLKKMMNRFLLSVLGTKAQCWMIPLVQMGLNLIRKTSRSRSHRPSEHALPLPPLLLKWTPSRMLSLLHQGEMGRHHLSMCYDFIFLSKRLLSYLIFGAYLIFRSATPGEPSSSYSTKAPYSRLPCICLIHLLTRYPHFSTHYRL